MSKTAWGISAYLIFVSLVFWFMTPEIYYQETGERAWFLEIGFSLLPLFGLYFVIKWDREDGTDS